MSTYWNYFCKTCNVSSIDDINHGDAELLKALSCIDSIKILHDTDIFDIDILYHKGDYISFLMEHYDHNIVVKSEYGNEKVL